MTGVSSAAVAGMLRRAFPGLRVTSGDRTQAQQRALIASGATQATNSQHLDGTALDVVLPDGVQPAQVATFLRSQGVNPSEFLNETGRGRNQGTGPHLHLGWGEKAQAAARPAPAATTVGTSTYDRARTQRAAQQDGGSSLQRVYAAYRAGRMSPEQAAQFEHDVNAGSILLPPGGSLKRTPAAPLLPMGVVRAYNDLNSGMTIEQRQQVDSDLHDGIASLPRGARLNPWRPMTTGENMRRSLGLGTRAVIEGVGDVAGLVMNPLNAALNATGLPQRLMGQPLAMANDPSVNIPDAIGLPRPQFDSERMASAVERGATAGLMTYGAGVPAAGARGMTGVVGRALTAAPVADVVSGGASGGSAEAARQEGFGPVGQLVAGVVGGGLGVGGTVAAERGAARLGGRRATDLPASTPRDVVIDQAGELTEDGRELVAQHGFTPEEIRQVYAAADGPPLAPEPGPRQPPPRLATDDPTDATPPPRGGNESRAASPNDDTPVAAPTDGVVPPQEAPLPPSRDTEPVPAAAAARDNPAGQPAPGRPRTAADRTRDAEALGIPLTRGQATQDFAIQDSEQTLRAQASGEGERARTFLADQAEKISAAVGRFREAFGSADATKTERGRMVIDALRDLRGRGKAGINALYREAQALGGHELSLDTGGIADAAKRVLVEADVPDGVKNVIRQELARYGLIGKKPITAEDGLTTVTLTDGRKVQFYGPPEPLTVGNAEQFRQAVSAQYMVDGPRKLSQSIKGAVDDAVENAVQTAVQSGGTGPVGQALKAARRAVVAHKETFNARDVVQRLVDWKKGTRTDMVLPEHAIRDVLAGDMTNLKRVKAVLLASPTPTSRAAWRAIQAEGVGGIFDRAYTANSNLGGGPTVTVSGAKLNTNIIKFGIPKLKVLLDPPDFDRLMSLRRVIGEATIPIAGTTNPSGSAFKLMRFLTPLAAKFSSIPFAGPVVDVASGAIRRAKATAEAERTLAGVTQYTPATAAREPIRPATGTPKTRAADPTADQNAVRVLEWLVEAARSGRLTSAVIAADGQAGQD